MLLVYSVTHLPGPYPTESKHPASEADAPHVTREIRIAIEADQRIVLEGQDVTLEALETRLLEVIGDETVAITISVASEVPMGLVSDVQQRTPIVQVAEGRSPLPQR